MTNNLKAILVVSFGTSDKTSGLRALNQIESYLRDMFPEYAIYRAWTSEHIRNKLLEQELTKINRVSEALEQMKQDGVRHVVIQPTFVIDGEENRRMREEALAYAGDFLSLDFGAPLLSDENDAAAVADAIALETTASFGCSKDDFFVFMGHGVIRRQDTGAASFDACSETITDADAMYALVDQQLHLKGYSNMTLKLMNAPEAIDEILEQASVLQPKMIYLIPFMITAGRHAQKEMAGRDDTSWASRLKVSGCPVRSVFTGLGEYEAIRRIFADHIRKIL